MTNFLCMKCGYRGNIQYPHPKNDVVISGNCSYWASPLPELTPKEREDVCRKFGLDPTTNKPVRKPNST